MIVTPAIDLMGGRCVQLVGGQPEDTKVSLPDPHSVARAWTDRGFESVHVVDLDAALGTGDNLELIPAVLGNAKDSQVGGGIRDEARASGLLDAGADRIVVGTRGLDDREWLSAIADRWPRRVVLALDFRNGVVLRKGWTESTTKRVEEVLDECAALPLAGVLTTDVGREGRLEGIDIDGCRDIIAGSPFPVWVSGGITTLDDLAKLEQAGATGAVLGMALYTGTMNADEVALRWGSVVDPSQPDEDHG
jgi:phosphoribosylformimino-5-aminoimidazole carboxamide ribotide isomerase